jgi:hypothetical protein
MAAQDVKQQRQSDPVITIPKTPSGKLQRTRLGPLHKRGALAVEAELHFGRRLLAD